MRFDKQFFADTIADIKNSKLFKQAADVYWRLGKLRPLVFVALFALVAGVVMLFFTHAETQISVACPTQPYAAGFVPGLQGIQESAPADVHM